MASDMFNLAPPPSPLRQAGQAINLAAGALQLRQLNQAAQEAQARREGVQRGTEAALSGPYNPDTAREMASLSPYAFKSYAETAKVADQRAFQADRSVLVNLRDIAGRSLDAYNNAIAKGQGAEEARKTAHGVYRALLARAKLPEALSARTSAMLGSQEPIPLQPDDVFNVDRFIDSLHGLNTMLDTMDGVEAELRQSVNPETGQVTTEYSTPRQAALEGRTTGAVALKPGTEVPTPKYLFQTDASGKKRLVAVGGEGTSAPQSTLGKLLADQAAATDPAQKKLFQERIDKEIGQLSTKDAVQYANQLGDDYVAASKNYTTVRDAYKRVQASVDAPSAAGDLSLIFNYMKMLDPNSVVRESEFQSAAAAGSYGERIQGLVNQALNGKRLSEEQRRDFVDRGRKLMNVAQDTQEQLRKNYVGIAKRANYKPEDITDRVVMLAAQGEEQARAQGGGAGSPGDPGRGMMPLPRVQSEEDLQQLVSEGKLKDGDHFLTADGREKVYRVR